MSEATQNGGGDLAAQLAAVTQQLSRMTQPATAAPAAVPSAPFGLQAQQPAPMGFGLPAQQPMQQPMPMAPMGGGSQPVGVSVPVKLPLPDGSSIRMYIQFGPEAAQNLQQTAMMAYQMFGQYLDAWAGRQGGNGGGFGGGFGRGGFGGGRRW